jgi:hypothetical protein
MRLFRNIFVVGLLIALTGCSTLEDAKNARGTGPFRI